MRIHFGAFGKENIKLVVKRITAKNLFWLALLTIIICSCFYTKVNTLCEKIVGEKKITVSITEEGKEVCIIGINGSYVDKETFENAEKDGGGVGIS